MKTQTAVMAQQVAQMRQGWGRTIAMVAQGLPCMVTEWRHSGRYCDRSMDPIGRPKGPQWWYKGSRSIAQIETQCLQKYTCFTERPMADHCASILRPLWCACLPPASFERQWVTDLRGDIYATVLNMLKTLQRPWRSWRGLNVPCATLRRPRQPFGLLCTFCGDLTSFAVAQRRHKGHSPCIKEV